MKPLWLARLRTFRQEVGPLWWYTILTFCASRIADLANLYIGVFYLPTVFSHEELGSVDPVTRLAGFGAIPMAIVSIVGAKYLSTYHARNEDGKIKQFMRDMALLGLISSVLFVIGLSAAFEPFRIRLGLDSRFLLPVLCAVGVLSCWQPLIQVVLQGMQRFNTVAFLGVAGNVLRLALVLCLVPLAHLSGYLFASFAAGVVVLGSSLWSLRWLMGPSVRSVAYYAEWRGILAYAWPVAIMTVIGSFQGFIEPFVVKHFLSAEDAAGFYMVCRFGFIPGYLIGAIGFVLFPLLSHRHERGEDTRAYLRQALLVTALVSGVGALVLGACSGWLFALMPQWRPFARYAPLLWIIGFQVMFDSVVAIYTTHEVACRRFRFLWIKVPKAILNMVILYGLFGWGAFQAWIPEGLWTAIDQAVPRTLTCAVAIMLGTRLIVAVGLALHWWAEERKARGPT